MKLSIILPFLVAGVFLCTSCGKKNYAEKNNICSASPTGDTVVIAYNTPTTFFASCKNSIQTTLTTIMDSRCPTDVVCVWEGKVSVLLTIDNVFNILLEPGIQKDTLHNNINYQFSLVDVIPHPISEPRTSVNDQKAIIRITRL